MVEEKENLIIESLGRILDFLNNRVWQNDNFPSAHRPDVPFLKSHLRVVSDIRGAMRETSLVFDPDIKLSIRKKLELSLRDYSASMGRAKIAWHDNTSGVISLSQEALLYGEFALVRILAHEAATHTACFERKIYPSQYSESQKKQVEQILKDAFDKKKRPTVADTVIAKEGFRHLLMRRGRGVIAELYPSPLIPIINEVYPNAFEMVTAYLTIYNFDEFNSLARMGRLPFLDYESSPLFARNLRTVWQFFDWQRVLDAFLPGQIQECYDHFLVSPRRLISPFRWEEDPAMAVDYLVSALAVDEGLDLNNL